MFNFAVLLKRCLTCTLLLALAACHQSSSNALPASSIRSGGDTPLAAVQVLLERLQANDLNGYWQAALTPENYLLLTQDWQRSRPGPDDLNPDTRKQIDQWLRRLALPGADDVLYLGLKPKLAFYQAQYQDQLSMLFGVAQIILGSNIEQNPALSPEQKQHAHAGLVALIPWAVHAPWFDPELAKQALNIACHTVRESGIRDIASLAALDFESAMAKYSAVLASLKQIFALYGLNWQQSLDSARLQLLDRQGNTRRVQIHYLLLGKPLHLLLKTTHHSDGRWYIDDLQQAVQAAHQRINRPAAAASPRIHKA